MLALSTGAVMALTSSATADPASAAEGQYLALVSVLALLVILELARGASASLRLLFCLPLLPGLALVALVPGAVRGLAVTLPLAFGLALVVARLAEHDRDHDAAARLWYFGKLVVACMGLQLLALSETLLAPTLRSVALVRWLGLPVLAATALAQLAGRLGPAPALLALAHVVLVSGRLGTSAVLVLIVFAAAQALRAPRRRVAALAILLSVPALHALVSGPILGLLSLVGALAFLTSLAWPAVLLVAAGLLSQLASVRPLGEAAAELIWLLPLLPGLWLCGAAIPLGVRFWVLLVSTLLALVSLCVLPPQEALVAPAALLVLLPPALSPAEHRARGVTAWCAVVLAFTLGVTSYPWLRRTGLEGLGDLAAETGSALRSRLGRVVLVHWPPRVLDAASPTLTFPLRDQGVDLGGSGLPGRASLVLDSAIANGAELPAGTVVATVRLPACRSSGPWRLRVGQETGEWAVARPDLASRLPVPRAWLSWVDPSGQFFGQSYRARLDLDCGSGAPDQPSTLELARTPGLPESVTLTVFHLDLRPRG